jgi:SAM-dependent methyltransferase
MVRVGEEAERIERRTTFDGIAEQYEAARPTYPAALLDDLVALAGIPDGGRIVEIGPGPGKATVALAERGFELTGVELGAELAAIARRRLAAFPNAEIVVADFEEWEPDRANFDAVVAFTSFHWIVPELRYSKSKRLLRLGGALAVVHPQHVVLPGDDAALWETMFSEDGYVPPAPDEVDDLREEIEATGLFGEVTVHTHLWDVEYTADEYVALLDTYSPMLAMPQEERREIYTRVHRLVTEHGGITETYAGVLNVARRRV